MVNAAHLMLPVGVQGSNQAIEDDGALLVFFSNLPRKEYLPQQLQMFDLVRRREASRMQILPSVPVEETRFLIAKLKGNEDVDTVVGEGQGEEGS